MSTEKMKYTPQDYVELDIEDHRRRFPEETKGMGDEKLFDIVMGTEDDMSDEDWRSLLKSKA